MLAAQARAQAASGHAQAPVSAASMLPPGFTLDAPPTIADRIGGAIGRGIIHGVADIPALAQGIGRIGEWADRQIGIQDPAAFDAAVHYPLRQHVDDEMDRQGFWYSPTSTAGKAAEAAIEGVTGGALTGGATTGLMTANAAAGAAGSLAQSAGMDPEAAAAISLALGTSPLAGSAISAARSAASDAAAAEAVARIAPAVTTDTDAAASALRSQSMIANAKATAPNATPAALASSVSGDLQRGLVAHIGMLRRTSLISAEDASDLKQAVSDAADPAKPGAVGQGTVDGLNLPGALAKPLSDGLADLNTISSGALTTPVAGPLARAGAFAARYGTPAAAAISGLHAGSFAPLAEAGAGLLGIAHQPVGRAGAAVGGLLDRLAGSSVDPSAAIGDAARATLGGASPGALPVDQLAQVRSAYADAQASAATDATRQAQTDAAWKQNAADQAATETAWSKAEAQRARQNGTAAPDPLSAQFWPAAPAASPNLSAVTNSQVKGFNADQWAQQQRDALEARQEAAAQARGAAFADQAGNWLERESLQRFKAANPGVPVTGAAALSAGDPQALFEATGGRYGSPGESLAPGGVMGPSGVATGASGASPALSPPAAATPTPASLQAPASGMSRALVSAPPAAAAASAPTPAMLPPTGFSPAFTGGKAYARQVYSTQFPGYPAPSLPELHDAINDLAADGTAHPDEVDAALAGGNITQGFGEAIADRVAQHRGQPSFLSSSIPGAALGQAQADVAGLMGGRAAAMPGLIAGPQAASAGGLGGAVPNGPSNMGVPIGNLPRWQSARSAYQAHAAQMMALAPTEAEKIALSAIAATPKATDKAALLAAYRAANPTASVGRFTPRLMRGA